MKVAVICAGGPLSEVADLTKFSQDETVFIGADRGALHLLQMGIVPDEAVGDFDSLTLEEYEQVANSVNTIGKFQAEKDETDTELAVNCAFNYSPKHIILTGVTGGRLDHMESALQLLYRLQTSHENMSFTIRNRTNELSILLPGTHSISRNEMLPYASFFPFGGTVKGLSLVGFKYETIEETLETGMTKFTSNEPMKEVCTISFHDGICLMVRSTDS